MPLTNGLNTPFIISEFRIQNSELIVPTAYYKIKCHCGRSVAIRFFKRNYGLLRHFIPRNDGRGTTKYRSCRERLPPLSKGRGTACGGGIHRRSVFCIIKTHGLSQAPNPTNKTMSFWKVHESHNSVFAEILRIRSEWHCFIIIHRQSRHL